MNTHNSVGDIEEASRLLRRADVRVNCLDEVGTCGAVETVHNQCSFGALCAGGNKAA